MAPKTGPCTNSLTDLCVREDVGGPGGYSSYATTTNRAAPGGVSSQPLWRRRVVHHTRQSSMKTNQLRRASCPQPRAPASSGSLPRHKGGRRPTHQWRVIHEHTLTTQVKRRVTRCCFNLHQETMYERQGGTLFPNISTPQYADLRQLSHMSLGIFKDGIPL